MSIITFLLRLQINQLPPTVVFVPGGWSPDLSMMVGYNWNDQASAQTDRRKIRKE